MKSTKKMLVCSVIVQSLLVLTPYTFGQSQEPAQAVKEITATRESMALSYPEGTTISIKFQGTLRLPRASGEAKVERKKGATEIEIELDEMKPATFFGGDYNTYVLWIVSPEGHVDNAGEFILEGNRSKLNVTTPLETFGMFITAEPHFLVSSPSRLVVMENTRPADNIGNPIKVSQIKYRGFEGVYNFERETLANMPEAKKEVRSDLGQARTAVELAARAGAESFAPEQLARAREALKKTEAAVAAGVDKRNVMALAHDAVRLAVEAQKLAEERAFQAALTAERKAHAEETSRLEKSIQEAQTEAERARLLAEQRELQLRIEERARQEALKQAQESARRAYEEEQRRREAEAEAQRARQEREQARAEMQRALSAIAETRETARGLIVNLPDILFDFNRASLRPQAREILSKITGILLVARGYRLSIEGHTDSVGSDEYNLKLSQNRAQSVRDYLVQAGLPPEMITRVQGLGESQPVAPNTTNEGRQKNRRVEIVIQDVGEPRVQ